MGLAETRDKILADVGAIKALVGNRFESDGQPLSLEAIRAGYDGWGMAFPLPDGATCDAINLGDVPSQKIALLDSDPATALLYFHGGGYGIGSPTSHRHLVGQLCSASGMVAYSVGYRLAPETPFPGAVDDAMGAYRALLAQGLSPEKIIIAGDSAGGGLALATALAIKAAGLSQPAGIFAISPWANLTQTGASYAAKADSDFICTQEALQAWSEAYLAGGGDPHDPLVSPVFGDFSDLAPILIHVGSEEILLSDALKVAEAAGLAKVPTTLVIAQDMPHVWHYMWATLSPARTAIAEAGAWMAERVHAA